jgi:hypothetical protein
LDSWESFLAGVVRGFLDFKVRGTSPQKTRWASCEWWLRFLAGASRRSLFVPPRSSSYDSLLEWIEKSVSPSLAVVRARAGQDGLDKVVDRGASRLNVRQVAMVNE